MKKLIILFMIILSFITLNVKALTVSGWYDMYGSDIEVPVTAQFYGWSNETTYSQLATNINAITSDKFIYSMAVVNNDSYGVSVYLGSNTRFEEGYLYFVNLYVCGMGTSPSDYNFYYGGNTANALTKEPTYSKKGNISLATQPFTNSVNQYDWCRNYTDVVSPSTSGRLFSLRLRNTPTARSSYNLLGYSVKPLGIYTGSVEDSIDNIIQNSGLATAQSINEVKSGVNEVKQEVSDINDTMNNSEVDSPESSFDSFNDMLPDNGTVTNLITLPITLITKINTSINGTCTAFSLGTIKGTQITLPCIDISDYIGSSLWGVIDVLFSGLFVLVIGKKMIAVFQNFSSMKEGDVLDD